MNINPIDRWEQVKDSFMALDRELIEYNLSFNHQDGSPLVVSRSVNYNSIIRKEGNEQWGTITVAKKKN